MLHSWQEAGVNAAFVGAGTLKIEASTKTLSVDNIVLHEGDYISLNGSKGDMFTMARSK